ncbi:MAG: radical SAM family heme chaperone HemW [Leptospiraceae bacterium]|nr:radical SAM family heme chaperone HemW [Leptospiraceae bacterium]
MERLLFGLYIHIPFCDVKCSYCDFYSLPRRHVDNLFWQKYLSRLKEDLEQKYSYLDKGYRLGSIFFGGGTPSKAPLWFYEQILSHILEKFHLRRRKKLEISIEVNPESFSTEKARAWAQLGINRINFGIQSRDPSLLRYLGRLYHREKYQKVVSQALKLGFPCVGVDLIYGIPGQRWRILRDDLTWALNEGVHHISLYALTIEPHTRLSHEINLGLKKKGCERRQVFHYQKARQFLLDHGFLHYEVSNYCRPGYFCLHNLLYWKYRPYMGLGVSAHSFMKNLRFEECRSLEKYLAGTPPKIKEADPRLEYFIGASRISNPQSLHRYRRLLPQNIKLLQKKLGQLELENKVSILTGDRFAFRDEALLFSDSLAFELASLEC